jgi:tRNA threonylcarbamoyl adenosine modification protein (Sua5/YciO/YrdC/YwlC family)
VDVGTGSGALAVVLARHLPQAIVWATDISDDALAVARDNARRYGLEARIRFVASDLLDALPGPFEIIVANLPYIDPQGWPELQASVRKFEPRLALDGGAGGTAVIERLIALLPGRLAVPGVALLECDPRQIDTLTAAAHLSLPDADVQVLKDLAGWDRVVRISRKGDGRMALGRMESHTRMLAGDAPNALREAVSTLSRGGLVVFPTDTVYGVGCDLRSPAALARLYAAKERPLDMAIPVLISSPDQVHQVARDLPAAMAALADRFWPGGLTIILPRRCDLPSILTAGGDTIAVRLPDHALARALIGAAGGALAVTSANRSGRPAPQTAAEALADLDGRVDLVLDGGTTREGVASSIVDLSVSPPRLLRRGALDVERLREVLPDLEA